jgi:hypothetical protein
MSMRVHSLFNVKTRRLVGTTLIVAVTVQSMSCGTIIHRDRWGQHSGRLDPSIVILDSLGLLVFFIPGVVAFIVDFSTGAIYLPDQYGQCPTNVRPQQMTRIPMDRGRMSREEIETVVRRQTGKTIDLGAPDVGVSRIQNLDEAPRAISQLSEPGPALEPPPRNGEPAPLWQSAR